LVGLVDEAPADQKGEESAQQSEEEDVLDVFEEDAFVEGVALREYHRREQH
jgi:hypothetical protein